jgi:HEAT repeats
MALPMLTSRVRWLLPVALALASCAPSPLQRAARSGNFGRLKTEIASERARGGLDRTEVLDLAREVGEVEMRRARGTEAIARIEDLRGCTYPFADTLESLARSPDDVGATATLVLLDGQSSETSSMDREELVRRYGSSESPLWRAVAARASRARGTGRGKFLVDPDERVRLAALRAALEVPDPESVGALLEAARVDPHPLARSLAVRGAGAVGHANVVLALHDLYAAADEDLRQAIVEAWATPGSAAFGGARELLRVAETDRGPAGIEAAAELLSIRAAAPPGVVDDDAAKAAVQVLARSVREGIARNRLLSIRQAPLMTMVKGLDMAPIREALLGAARGDDEAVRAAALGRLLELSDQRGTALAALRKSAAEGSRAALFELAHAKDKSAVEGLARETTARDGEARLAAARALIEAGALDRAADLLADSDPHVRLSASCALVVASRR